MSDAALARTDLYPTRTLPVHRSRLLATLPGIVHGLTGRVPGLGAADGNVGYSPPRDVNDAWRMRQAWSAAIGVDPGWLVTSGQEHGTTILHVTAAQAGRGGRPGTPRLGLADALITDEPGVALMTLHADCVPILLVDRRRPAIAAVHAGWRGTVNDIAGATLLAMHRAFGSQPANIVAYLGPAIGACCYQVGADVAAAWQTIAGTRLDDVLQPDGERWRFNLHAANRALLVRAGVPASQIERSAICTCCAADGWFSHRGQGSATGRFGAVIALGEPPALAPNRQADRHGGQDGG